MNKRKYLNDAYTLEFQSRVSKRLENGGIVLEETYFYPEGGGQPHDIGFLNGLEVLDVQLLDQEVVHTLNGTLELNDPVLGIIDANRRIGYMHQHTTQHLISAYAYKTFGANTVGIHISAAYFTVDFDQKLTESQVMEIVSLCENHILKGGEVRTHYVDPQDLSKYPLRKQPKVNENIRLIEIDGLDFSPCGGTHVENLKELGGFLIKKVENYKSGIRLTVQSGLYAMNQLKEYHSLWTDFTRAFAVQPTEALSFTQKMSDALKSADKEIEALSFKLLENEVKEILSAYSHLEGPHYILLLDESYPMNLLREKVQRITQALKCVVFAVASHDDKHHFVAGKSQDTFPHLNVSEAFKTHLGPFGIKGGGSALLAQGGCQSEIYTPDMVNAMKDALKSLMSI